MFNTGSKSNSKFSVETINIENNCADFCGEKRLLKAMIERAVADLESSVERRESLEWLIVPEVEDPLIMSFQYACMHLNLDYGLTQEYIRNKLKEILEQK